MINEASAAAQTAAKIAARTALVGVIGLGYVGLPLAAATARAGFSTIGFDVDTDKLARFNAGHSYIDAVTPEELAGHVASGCLRATGDFAELADCDVIVICVPTPLTRQREPDLTLVVEATRTIARHLRQGQLVVLESTTWPGTTEQVIKPILEAGGLRSGRDVFLAYSPEREDPGNPRFRTVTIPKVVAGAGAEAAALAEAFYGAVVERVVPVSSPAAAEAVKITENVFRAVNIALANELKVIYDAMGIDIWEVIEAAATKPFGYMPFYPGPGPGGHCIPIDPFYLTWKSREYGLETPLVELAGEINLSVPHYVVSRTEQALDRYLSKSLGQARILILGLAYKKNVSDVRESPAFALTELLEARGTRVDYHDPHVPTVPPTPDHAACEGRKSVPLSSDSLIDYDLVLIATDHDAIDYELVARHALVIVDTRNAMARRGLAHRALVKA